ncbi:MAG: CoA transferase [Acidimicrobiaceae bacterium]|nr:CoA transferase [Acidimicrobiaceae bacterium]
MAGVRVLELASWMFVPAAGAVLADWGADVIKVEHPSRPDPQRGLAHSGLSSSRRLFLVEQGNRGKRSITLDIRAPGGLDLLYRLAASSDVFLTNWLPEARRKLHVDVNDIRAHNPRIVYVRGSGQGVRGPEKDKAGFDGTSFVARGSFADGLTPPGSEWPVRGTAAVGDLPGAMTIAGGIAAGLFHRERTGEAPVVDVSLLGVAMWTMAPDIVATGMHHLERMPRPPREQVANPISIYYRSKDDRIVKLSMFESDRYFPDLCDQLSCPELAVDPRFVDAQARADNNTACIAALDEVFGRYTLQELIERLEKAKGSWAVVQHAAELHRDRQVLANGYLVPVEPEGEEAFSLVGAPVQFDEQPPQEFRAAPEHGENTEDVLLELGLTWDEISEAKGTGAIG